MIGEYWIPIKDGDPRAVALYNRHYSARDVGGRKLDRVRYGFSGNGESLVLLTLHCDALYCWRYQRKYQKDGQEGLNCSIFRNEGDILSSVLISEACEWADAKWGKLRKYTYVNPEKIKHKRDPGRCFIKAGWHNAGISPQGLVILELAP